MKSFFKKIEIEYIKSIYSKSKMDFNTTVKKLKYTRIPECFMVKATMIFLLITYISQKLNYHEKFFNKN